MLHAQGNVRITLNGAVITADHAVIENGIKLSQGSRRQLSGRPQVKAN